MFDMRRHELYTDYKAQRPPMPDAMKLAIPKIQQLLQVCDADPTPAFIGAQLPEYMARYSQRASTQASACGAC